jgi:hypothetical protein
MSLEGTGDEMDRKEKNEIMKRKINANAFALEALAAFGRFRTSLSLDIPAEARAEQIQNWTRTASSVVNEQIEELEAYERSDIKYPTPAMDFTINMSTLSFLEIMFVLSDDALISILAETCSVAMLQAAIKHRAKLLREGKIPEDPENPIGGN